MYRTSARIPTPPKEFPTRLVLMVVALVVLVGGSLASWKYFESRSSAKQPAGSVTTEPAKATDLSNPKGQDHREVPQSCAHFRCPRRKTARGPKEPEL